MCSLKAYRKTYVVEGSTAVGEGDDLDRSILALGHAQVLGTEVGQAEDTSTVDIERSGGSERDVEVDAIGSKVEEGVDLLVGVIVGDGTAIEGPEGTRRAVRAVDTGTWGLLISCHYR
jgi:hypothetical protein